MNISEMSYVQFFALTLLIMIGDFKVAEHKEGMPCWRAGLEVVRIVAWFAMLGVWAGLMSIIIAKMLYS